MCRTYTVSYTHLNDQLGTSLILVNSDKGKSIYEALKSEMELCEKIDLEEIRKYNGQILQYLPHRIQPYHINLSLIHILNVAKRFT